MGSIINSSHSEMTQAIINLQSDLLKNPFYLFNDKKAVPVEYYNINTTKSTLDQGLKVPYSNLGKDCPLKFNLVHDFYIYGIDRVGTSLENGEFGIEAGDIAGDAIILPNSIKPYPGDYFYMKMLKKKYLFWVTAVHTDTFEDGGNYWRIEYKLAYNDNERLTPLVVREFNFVSGNVGTNYSPVLTKQKWDICKILDDASVALKNYYKALYYNNKVQTYTFVYLYNVCQTNMNSDYFYDPYMIEFVKNNNILKNSGVSYDYIDHKTVLKADFPIKYSKSIWKVLEDRDKDSLPGCRSSSAATYIDDPGSIFATRYEDYFELTYNVPNPVAEQFAIAISILDPQVIGHVENNQLFDQNTKYAKYNILIKYFNKEDIAVEDIAPYERIMEYDNNTENYFLIPMAIFIIERYIKELMLMKPED